MTKVKNASQYTLRFDLGDKEKTLIPDATLEIPETNSYIDGLIAQGILEEVPTTKNKE